MTDKANKPRRGIVGIPITPYPPEKWSDKWLLLGRWPHYIPANYGIKLWIDTGSEGNGIVTAVNGNQYTFQRDLGETFIVEIIWPESVEPEADGDLATLIGARAYRETSFGFAAIRRPSDDTWLCFDTTLISSDPPDLTKYEDDDLRVFEGTIISE